MVFDWCGANNLTTDLKYPCGICEQKFDTKIEVKQHWSAVGNAQLQAIGIVMQIRLIKKQATLSIWSIILGIVSAAFAVILSALFSRFVESPTIMVEIELTFMIFAFSLIIIPSLTYLRLSTKYLLAPNPAEIMLPFKMLSSGGHITWSRCEGIIRDCLTL